MRSSVRITDVKNIDSLLRGTEKSAIAIAIVPTMKEGAGKKPSPKSLASGPSLDSRPSWEIHDLTHGRQEQAAGHADTAHPRPTAYLEPTRRWLRQVTRSARRRFRCVTTIHTQPPSGCDLLWCSLAQKGQSGPRTTKQNADSGRPRHALEYPEHPPGAGISR